jgi:hypothetical protein
MIVEAVQDLVLSHNHDDSEARGGIACGASRLTLLSPAIIEAILEGRQPAALELVGLLGRFAVEWDKQLETLCES